MPRSPKAVTAKLRILKDKDLSREQFSATLDNLLDKDEQDRFRKIVLDRTRADVKPRVERGSQQYDQSCTLDGKPSVAMSIYQLPGSNALDTRRRRVREK